MPDDPNLDPKKENPPDNDPAAAKASEELKVVNARLDELQKVLQGASTKDDVDEKRKQFQARYNLDDKQMEGVQAMINSGVSSRLAVINRTTGEDRARTALKGAAKELMPEVLKIMSQYGPEHQGDPNVWEQAAQLVIGKNVDLFTKSNAGSPDNNGGKGNPSGPSIRSANVGGFNRSTPTNPGNGGGSGQYSPEEQAVIDRNHGGKAEDYEKFKKETAVVGPDYYDPKRGKPIFK